MKKITLFGCLIGASFVLQGQTYNYAVLDIGNIRASFSSDGELFNTGSTFFFEVPKGNSDNANYAAHLWMGGIDAQGLLHAAAQTYRQMGNDYYPGPIMSPSSYSPAQDALWNKVWKINKSTIDSFRLGLYTNTPQIILDWPGNGNVSLGQAAQLAPYKDVNGDNLYNPADGDFPCIKGDQAVYMIFNDDRNLHMETGGNKFVMEIHAMAYAFKDTNYPHLQNSVFLNNRIINRSVNMYQNTFIGLWNDFDLGDYSDDFVGSNVERNYNYVYNGDNQDGNGGPGSYGANPPALGAVFLKGPLADFGDGTDNNMNCMIDESGETCLQSKYVYYNNDFTFQGNPTGDSTYYTYLQGQWRDSTSITYGGTGYGGILPTSYMYPGNTDLTIAWGTGGNCQNPAPIQPVWDEMTAGNTPADRRGMGSSGPFTLMPNEELCLDYAYVFAQGSSNLASVTLLETSVDTIRSFYFSRNLDTCSCVVTPLGLGEILPSVSMNLYPNPVNDLLQLVFASDNEVLAVSVFDLSGKLILCHYPEHAGSTIQLNTSNLRSGIYLVRAETKVGVVFRKFIKE